MKRLLFALILTLAPLAAQDPQPYPAKIQKLFILKYADPRSVQALLTIFDANTRYDSELHTIAVTAAPPVMQAVEDAISKLDLPAAASKNIDLVMQLVIGSDSENAGAPIPRDLEPVVTQLKNAFPFKNYRLLDVLTLRSRIGQQRANTDSSGGTVQFGTLTRQVISNFAIRSSSLGPDGTVRLDGVQASSKFPMETSPGQFNYQDLSLNTDVDIREGQKVVIGRHGITRDQALFLVLSARVVQ